ncbi:hypothetical protein H5V45_12890 [Nocardioides sp. KIGAM211]|uniref:Uncharacterized protein n=1 Tax=Nocardioides luti TaxID=2761101 RepID=A0A7X0RH40_9ACTN|nr:hypothetical protein [Nocardioides luti]MBB6628218.1 hypothetical protein [Nocardioides luti]
MRTAVRLLLATVLGTAGLVGPPLTTAASARTDDWHGSRHAMPGKYAWLDDITPSDTYTIVVVRGMGRAAVVRHLGGVKRKLAAMTPTEAETYLFDHVTADYSWPRVVQVQRRGHAVVVYAPYGVLDDAALARLSRHGRAAEFFTDVELDTSVTVAKKGEVVRQFDAGFKPPKEGALRAERGLDWGAPDQNVWATAWAFDERISRTHISRTWFDQAHPTFIAKKGAL